MIDDTFAADLDLTIRTAVKFKRVILSKPGRRQAVTTCPKCGGRLSGRVAGNRNHLHMACETPGCLRMME